MDAALAALDAGATVVTANKRLARVIGHASNERQRARGRRAWSTPAVLPWRAWLAELWSQSLAAGGAAGRLDFLSDAQARVLWRAVVGDAGLSLLPGATAAIADLAGCAWRRSAGFRLTPERLLAAADSDDAHAFATLAAGYRRRCAELGCADAEMLVPALVEDFETGRLRTPQRLHAAGFEELTPLERELLAALEQAGATLTAEEPALGAAALVRIACADSATELELAARWARARVEAEPAAKVGIVVPDLASRSGEARRAILGIVAPDWRLARPAELPANFSYGEPLAATGIVHAALLAMRALSGRLNKRDAGQLLRTPYLNGARVESTARAALDLTLRERVGDALTTAELAACATAAAPLFGAQLRALAAVDGAQARSAGAARWAATFEAALRAVGWPGDRAPDSDEYQALGAWRETLEELASVDALAGPLSLGAALELLGELAGARAFQPEGHSPAIQVLGTLEALGQRFDALWISGLNAASWPPGARPDPLLPLALQRELGMPDATPALTRERAERLLLRLQASALAVVVSHPEHAGDETLAPSPLIASLPLQPPATLALWTGTGRCAAIAASGAAELLAVDPPPPVAPGETLRGGAALLERQARCPARAFLEFRLGAGELRRIAPGIDARLRGAILHGVLQDALRTLGGQARLLELDAPAEAALLASIVRRRLAAMLPQDDPLIACLAREEERRLMRMTGEFLRLERLRPPFTVLAAESALSAAAAPAPLAALALSLRPDRVDELADGRRVIIDYKTATELPTQRDLVGARPHAPQLPLYASLGGAAAIALVHIGAAGVRCLAVGEESVSYPGVLAPAELTGGAAEDWAALCAQWSAALARLAAELLAGDFRVGRRDEAGGEWGMATRVHELPEEEDAL